MNDIAHWLNIDQNQSVMLINCIEKQLLKQVNDETIVVVSLWWKRKIAAILLLFLLEV